MNSRHPAELVADTTCWTITAKAPTTSRLYGDPSMTTRLYKNPSATVEDVVATESSAGYKWMMFIQSVDGVTEFDVERDDNSAHHWTAKIDVEGFVDIAEYEI